MRIKTLVLAGLVLWAWSGVPAFAQEQTVLEFVDRESIALLIDTPTEVDRRCGMSESAMDAAVRLPLSRNGFRFNSRSQDLVRVRLASMEIIIGDRPYPLGCAVHVNLIFMRAGLFGNGTPIYDAAVWSRGGLLTGPAINLGGRVNDQLESYTNQLIAKWLIDNPQ